VTLKGGPEACPPKKIKTRVSEMACPVMEKTRVSEMACPCYGVLKVTKCHKISQIVLSTPVSEIISIIFAVFY
jgi:hypothetical protein